MSVRGDTEQSGATEAPLPVDAAPGLPGGGLAASASGEDDAAVRYAIARGGSPISLAKHNQSWIVELQADYAGNPAWPVIICMTQDDARALSIRLRTYADLLPGEPAPIVPA